MGFSINSPVQAGLFADVRFLVTVAPPNSFTSNSFTSDSFTSDSFTCSYGV